MTEHQPRASRFFLRLHALACAVAATFLLAACEESSGVEPIAGASSLLIEGTAPLPTAQVALVWMSNSGPFYSGVLVSVDEDGSYSLEATEAPPSYAFDSDLRSMLAEQGVPDPRMADAIIVGLSAGADVSATNIESEMLNAFVVYVEEDLDIDSFAGRLYGPLGRGYHLLQIVPGPTREVWAHNGEVCEDDDDCAGPGASGMAVDGSLVPIAFQNAPPLVSVDGR